MKGAPLATNTLPLPPKRRRARKYSLPGSDPPPRHLLGPKPERLPPKDADSSEIDKSDINISDRVSCSDLSTTDSGIVSASERVGARPPSLDLSSPSRASSGSASPPDPPPLPPRRPLRGHEPPPRSSLGPKPPRFRALGADSESSGDSQRSDASSELIPVIHVTDVEGPTDCTTTKDVDDNLSLDDVFIDDPESDAPDGDLDSLPDAQIKFIDDASPDPTDAEARMSNTGALESDVESQRWAPAERSDADSQLDIQSESSVDTVATAIELRERPPADLADILTAANDEVFIIHNPSYDSLNTYELLSTDRLSVIDSSNPKLAKDLKNKMSKESTQRLSKNLAAEITDFFKSSASKLKPPCLDQPKKDTPSKKQKTERDTEPCLKMPQRLIPRSPYISAVPVFEKTSPRKPTKQPPFYVWNINSKNAAVCPALNPPLGYRTLTSDESKALKDIENNTRKMLDMSRRSYGAPVRTSPTKAAERDAKSASTGQLATKPPRRDLRLPHSQSNDLKPKTCHTQAKVFLSRNKVASRPRPSPHRLVVPKPAPWDASPTKPSKLPSKNLPKINIPLPSPHITVTKVKTQLPCDFTTSRTCENIAKINVFKESRSLPNVTVSIEACTKKSWVKKWKSVIHDLFKKHHMEFYINGVPPCYNFKRSNTWPPKTNSSYADDLSKYVHF